MVKIQLVKNQLIGDECVLNGSNFLWKEDIYLPQSALKKVSKTVVQRTVRKKSYVEN
jgi:hypothetical protein